ncbi:MAG: hypothetical protein JSR62_05670 [Nitrospira sp.]|nr:hypothetical protein [Nitrospira sp.]
MSRQPSAVFTAAPVGIGVVLLLCVGILCAVRVFAIELTDRARDGLVGAVKTVVTKSGLTTTVTQYDAAGTLKHIQVQHDPPADQPDVGGSVEEVVYEHDSRGTLISELIVDEVVGPYPSRRYAYDGNGNRVAEAAYNVCGTFSYLHVYGYDENKRVNEDLLYKSRSVVRTLLEYDRQGSLARRRHYQHGAMTSSTEYAYDLQDQMTEQRVYLPDGALSSRTTYAYDDRGHTISEEVRHSTRPSQDSKEVSTYEYDAIGNWTKRTIHRELIPLDEDGKPVLEAMEVMDRVITYY